MTRRRNALKAAKTEKLGLEFRVGEEEEDDDVSVVVEGGERRIKIEWKRGFIGKRGRCHEGRGDDMSGYDWSRWMFAMSTQQ